MLLEDRSAHYGCHQMDNKKLEQELNELVAVLEKCKAYCPWTHEQSVESYAPHVLEEAKELLEAIEKKDFENLKEELGDILWDTLMVAHIAQDKGMLKVEDVIRGIIEKMKRRKPFVFDGRSVSIAEAQQLWEEVKEKEKKEKTQ